MAVHLGSSPPESSLQRWARRYSGPQAPFTVMSSPPTVTIGTATSTVNGKTSGQTSIAWNDSRLTHAGTTLLNDGASPSRGYPGHQTYVDSTKFGGNNPVRTRFITDAPKFEVLFRGSQNTFIGAVIDGQYVARSGKNVLPNSGNPVNVLFDFGADSAPYQLAQITKSAGGSNYAVGDIITLAGGTSTTAATVKVIQISGSAVAAVEVQEVGAYSVVPTGTISQASTTGSGTGATFVSQVWGKSHTNRKLRTVEIIWHGAASKLYGLNITTSDTVLAYPVPTSMPKLCIIGDSQSSGTYLQYAGGHYGCTLAQRLGLWDRLSINAAGSTGWLQANTTNSPNIPAWSDALRVADFIAEAADIYLFVGSQNDASGTGALTSAATSVVDQIQAATGAYVIGIGSLIGISTVSANVTLNDAIEAGFLGARDQSRVRFIDNVSDVNFLGGTGKITAEAGSGAFDHYLASDGLHLAQSGADYLGNILAPYIADKLLSMAL